MRATAYFNLEKADSVRMDIRQVLRLTENPQTAEEYEAKCYALKILNKSDEALKNCAKALELDSDLALAYNVRGTIYHHRGMYDLAIAEYSKAIERIRRASFFENRAISYEEMKKKNLAEADYKMADTLRNSKLSAPTSNAQAGGPLTKKPEAPQVSKPKLQPMAEKPPQPKPAARKPKITIDDIMKP
jgi:tetratricopeptide (TPR) repeat protein